MAIEESKKRASKREMDSELRRFVKKYQTTAFLEPVRLAVILGEEGVNYRWAVERAGMEAVMDYERGGTGGDPEKLSRTRDVSHMFKRYDIESFNRVIEVKSFKDTRPIEPLGHEWQTASRKGEGYWPYVVENALAEPKIYTTWNPAEKFREKENRRNHLQILY